MLRITVDRTKIETGKVSAAVHRGAVRGLRNAAEHLLAESTAQAPIEEQVLIGTAVASVDSRVGAEAAAVSYDTVYAARQHEETTWRHDPGRKAKYLEDPLASEAPTMRDLIAAAIRRELR